MIPSVMSSSHVADCLYFIRRCYTRFHLYVVENIYLFYLCQFINDLEKDRQYWGWPSELQDVSTEEFIDFLPKRVRNSTRVIQLTLFYETNVK